MTLKIKLELNAFRFIPIKFSPPSIKVFSINLFNWIKGYSFVRIIRNVCAGNNIKASKKIILKSFYDIQTSH